MRDDVCVTISPDRSPRRETKEERLTWACSDPSSVLPAAFPGSVYRSCLFILTVVIRLSACLPFFFLWGEDWKFVLLWSWGRHGGGECISLLAVLLSSQPRSLARGTDGRHNHTVQVLGTRKMTNKPGVRKRIWAVELVGARGLWHREGKDLQGSQAGCQDKGTAGNKVSVRTIGCSASLLCEKWGWVLKPTPQPGRVRQVSAPTSTGTNTSSRATGTVYKTVDEINTKAVHTKTSKGLCRTMWTWPV